MKWFKQWTCYVEFHSSQSLDETDINEIPEATHPGPVDNKALLNGKKMLYMDMILL